MGLFSNPVTLVDGLAANRIFAYRSPIFDKKNIVAEYIETAASIAANSVLRIKHDPTGAAPRHLLQRSIKRAPAASPLTLLPITVNFTVVASPLFTDAEVNTEVMIVKNAILVADFTKSLLNNLT